MPPCDAVIRKSNCVKLLLLLFYFIYTLPFLCHVFNMLCALLNMQNVLMLLMFQACLPLIDLHKQLTEWKHLSSSCLADVSYCRWCWCRRDQEEPKANSQEQEEGCQQPGGGAKTWLGGASELCLLPLQWRWGGGVSPSWARTSSSLTGALPASGHTQLWHTRNGWRPKNRKHLQCTLRYTLTHTLSLSLSLSFSLR